MGTSAAGRRIETFDTAGHSRSLRNREPVVHEHRVGQGTRDRLPHALHRHATVERHVQWPSGDNNHLTLVVSRRSVSHPRRQRRDEQRRGSDGMTRHRFFVLFCGAASCAASARSVAADSCSVAITLPVTASTLTSSTPFLPATVKSYE